MMALMPSALSQIASVGSKWWMTVARYQMRKHHSAILPAVSFAR